MKKNLPFAFSRYVSKRRWVSYWHQVDEVIKSNPNSLLIIGKGDGIVGDILKKEGINVITFDFDSELNPDFLGNVIEIKSVLKAQTFDTILCCEVLEHIPFDHFEEIIRQLNELTKKYLVLSLPLYFWEMKLTLKIHRKSLVNFHLIIPRFTKRPPVREREHYWEIGRGHSFKEVKLILEKYFTITKNYAVKEQPYHMFFCLEKKCN